jgi:hypothetical protein
MMNRILETRPNLSLAVFISFTRRFADRPHPSFALIVIFAFSTFDTGHPFSAASAYF